MEQKRWRVGFRASSIGKQCRKTSASWIPVIYPWPGWKNYSVFLNPLKTSYISPSIPRHDTWEVGGNLFRLQDKGLRIELWHSSVCSWQVESSSNPHKVDWNKAQEAETEAAWSSQVWLGHVNCGQSTYSLITYDAGRHNGRESTISHHLPIQCQGSQVQIPSFLNFDL